MPKPTRLKTDKPTISDAVLANIRKDARDYLLAGGAVYREGQDGGSRDEHIENTRERLSPGASERVYKLLERITDDEDRRRLENAMGELTAASYDAGHVFGVCVGSEVARLTVCGQLPRAQKGGRR